MCRLGKPGSPMYLRYACSTLEWHISLPGLLGLFVFVTETKSWITVGRLIGCHGGGWEIPLCGWGLVLVGSGIDRGVDACTWPTSQESLLAGEYSGAPVLRHVWVPFETGIQWEASQAFTTPLRHASLMEYASLFESLGHSECTP